MTPAEFIAGLRERGYSVIRMQEGPQVIIPRVEVDDPLAEWLSRDLGCKLVTFQPDARFQPHLRAYEVRLNTAAVVVDYPDNLVTHGERALYRGMAIWEAAGV